MAEEKMTWKDVVSSKSYKELPVDQRIRVADSFFSSKVAPELSEDDFKKGRRMFYEGVVQSDPEITKENIGELEGDIGFSEYLKSPEGKRLLLEIAGGMAGGVGGKIVTKGAPRLTQILSQMGGVSAGSAAGSLASEEFDPSERPWRAAGEAALYGAGGEIAGRLAGRLFLGRHGGAKRLESGAKEAVEQLQGRALPTPGQLSTNAIVDATEQIAEGSFLGGKRILASREAATEVAQSDIGAFVGDLLRGVRGEEAGKLAKLSIEGNTDAFRATAQGLFRKVDEYAKNINVSAEPILKRARELSKELSKGLPKQTKAARGVIDDVMERLEKGNISFEEAQAIRSDLLAIGRTDDPISGKAEAIAKQLAKTVDNAMETAAKSADPKAFRVFRRANKYWKKGSEVFNSEVIKRIARSDPEEVGRIMAQAEKPGTIKRIKSAIRKDKETWDVVRGNTLLRFMERSANPETGQLSAKQMLTKLRNYGEDSLDVIMSSEERKQLNQLLRTLSITQTKASKAGGFDVYIKLAQGGAFTDLLTFQFFDPVTSSVIAFGPEVLSRILTRPKVVKRITVGLKAPPGSTEARRAFTQTAAMLADEPGVQIMNAPTQREKEQIRER